jgi:RNA recognition motif-containing protein
MGISPPSGTFRDKPTGYSYGFGFIDYQSPTDAQRAIESLNGLQLQNKKMKVAYSK